MFLLGSSELDKGFLKWVRVGTDNSWDLGKTELIYNYLKGNINDNYYIYSFYYAVDL
jgi:hypothetical protein